MTKRTCDVDGCDRPSRSRGWCHTHYTRWRRYGDPTVTLRPVGVPAIERFWAKVNFDGHCWLWTAALTGPGYAQFGLNGGNVLGHRFAYEALVGPIPDGLTLDHLCRIRHCVNPGHLEPVTLRENILRGESPFAHKARQTHCRWGHEFTDENTYRKVTAKGRISRQCRACGRRRARDYAASRPQTSQVQSQ